MKLNTRNLILIASVVFGANQMAHSATIWSFDNFNNRPTIAGNHGTLSSSTETEAATAWKNVQGLTNLNDTVTLTTAALGSVNFWDRPGNGETGTTAIRFRNTTGQITTDNPMTLVTFGATSATMKWDYLPDTDNYNVGLYYARSADTTVDALILLQVFNGSVTSSTWQNASVTITDGVDGIVFTNTARFVLKYHSGAVGNGIDQHFDNIEISYVPEPSAALFGGLSFLVLLRRRR